MRLTEAMEGFAWGPIGPERPGKHPRIFLTVDDIPKLQERAQGPLKGDWLAVQSQTLATPRLEPTSLCYLVSGDPFYLGLAREQIHRVMSIEAWAGDPYDPSQNKDLAMGHNLTALAFAYDMLYQQLTPEERQAIREQLVRNCRLTYQHYTRPHRVWAYAQNHPYLPMVGMALTAYALYGEVAEAEDWLKLSGAFLQRTFQCNGTDGWYYEGWGYWNWAVPILAIYAEARYQMTGSKDALSAPLMRNLPTYVRYMLLPGGQESFDFGDCHGMYVPDWERFRLRPYDPDYYFEAVPWRQVRYFKGGLLGNAVHPEHFCPVQAVDLIAARFQDRHAQQLADYLRLRGHRDRGIHWSLLWKDADLETALPADLPAGHYFDDHEIAIWRSSWEEKATAVAVKCGPPMGHRNLRNLKEIPDLKLGAWHAHPDAGSFLVFSHGQFLATDTGYTCPKRSVDHNVLLINGRGQEPNGGYSGFAGLPYEQLNEIRLNRVDIQEDYMFVEADMTSAYPADLEMDRVIRRLLVTDSCLVIWDLLEASYPHDYAWLLHTDTDYELIGGAWQTRKGDVAMQVHFLVPADLQVEVQKTSVISHQHAPHASGPSQDRGHHLVARLRGSSCRYVTCLTWGWQHTPMPKVSGSLEQGQVTVSCQRDGQRMLLTMTGTGGDAKIEE